MTTKNSEKAQFATLQELMDLLAERAVQGLTPPQQRRLATLLARHPELDEELLDRAAAATALAWSAPGESASLPSGLRQRLLADAPQHLPTPKPPALKLVEGDGVKVTSPTAPSRGSGKGLGWWAAAAALALALAGWWPTLVQPPGGSPPLGETNTPLPEQLARYGDIVNAAWQPTTDPLAQRVSGVVTWSTEAQQGYLTLVGLPANDPNQHQYQLWIVDAERDTTYPVDGGVFDIPPAAAAERVTEEGAWQIPIRAKLPVFKPTLFAITLEAPGGVVVSSGERMLLTAAVPPASAADARRQPPSPGEQTTP